MQQPTVLDVACGNEAPALRLAGALDKPRDVVLGHEVPHIRRQKQRLIDIPGAKVPAHRVQA
jgi:hypothetical protein